MISHAESARSPTRDFILNCLTGNNPKIGAMSDGHNPKAMKIVEGARQAKLILSGLLWRTRTCQKTVEKRRRKSPLVSLLQRRQRFSRAWTDDN